MAPLILDPHSKSAPPREDTQKMDLVSFGGVGVRVQFWQLFLLEFRMVCLVLGLPLAPFKVIFSLECHFKSSKVTFKGAQRIPFEARLRITFEDYFRLWGYRSIQNYYPRNFIFSELIRRGVIYCAGNFLPQIMFFWINYAG